MKKFASHNGANYYQFAITQADSLKIIIQKPASSVDSQLRQIRASDIAKKRGILKSMAEAVLLCGRQGIALHGHRDDSTAEGNSDKGTFPALLDYSVKLGNEILAKTTKNNLIQAIGDQLRNKLLLEINNAK